MNRVPGTYKDAPAVLRRDRSLNGARAEEMIKAIGAITAERWRIGDCYPTWDEIKAAIYGLPQLSGVTMAQVLTPDDGSVWVNVHDNCFHLYEIHDEGFLPA